MSKCVNIDWLECYCLEDPITYPHDAEFFRKHGWSVREREYGTPMYHEMFTLINAFGEDEIEIRRKPKSDNRDMHGLFDPNSCHVRLCNRSCYYDTPATFLALFLDRHGLCYQRISRIDICLDFVRFDFGDWPHRFMKRYMEGKYAKINQANISAHGSDSWDGRVWNSVSWGAPKSMIKTRFYCKSLELRQVKDKPYIRQAWKACGFIDDEYTFEKQQPDGTLKKVDVWRVEFQVKSGTKNWFVIEEDAGKKTQLRSIRNDLSVYASRADVYRIFLSLAQHYFHFKKYRPDVRKDRCPDKPLFQTADIRNWYKLETVRGTGTPPPSVDKLLERIIQYRNSHPMPEIYKACNVLIEQLEFERRSAAINHPWPVEEIQLLRHLISIRIKGTGNSLSQDLEETKALMNFESKLFPD